MTLLKPNANPHTSAGKMDPKDVKTAFQAVEDVCSLPPEAIKPLDVQEGEH